MEKTAHGILPLQELEVSKNISAWRFKKCNGIMGVPISFYEKYCSEQFIVIGLACGWNGTSNLITTKYPKSQIQHAFDKKSKSFSIRIVNKLNDGTATIKINKPLVDGTYYEIGQDLFIRKYAQILIKKKEDVEHVNENNRT